MCALQRTVETCPVGGGVSTSTEKLIRGNQPAVGTQH